MVDMYIYIYETREYTRVALVRCAIFFPLPIFCSLRFAGVVLRNFLEERGVRLDDMVLMGYIYCIYV